MGITLSMDIAFVTSYDSRDVRSWSGVPVHMSAGFESLGHSLDRVGPLKGTAAGPSLVKAQLYRWAGRRYLRDRDPTLLHSYARQVKRRLDAGRSDIVVSVGSLPVAYLETDKPLAIWGDVCFAAMAEYYPEFSNLPARTMREGNRAEQSALSRCTLAIFSTEWAARAAIAHYDVDPAKVRVIPLGANITESPAPAAVERMVAARSRERCIMLFLAADWSRKGGDFAFEVTEALNASGVPTELQVCGQEPPAAVLASPHVRYLGYVSKGTAEGRAQWANMLTEAHFLILPTRRETFGSATCEVNAYGIPSLINDVGGTSGVVTNEINGLLFDPDAPATVWRDGITRLWSDPDWYAKLAMTSQQEFATRLNWPTGCRTLVEMLTGATPT